MSTVIYQGTLKSRNRKWVFQLIKPTGTLISDDHDVTITSKLQWGEDSTTGFLDRLILPASLAIEFTDPGSVIFDDMRTSGPNVFTLRVYDITLTYEMDLYVRLADAFTPLKDDISVATTMLMASCGITRLPEIDAPASDNDTTHLVFRRLLVDTLRGQDIQYLFGTRNSRASGPWITSTRYEDLEFQYTGLGENPDEKDTAGNMLTDFVEAYQCMVFNDLFYGRRWMVAQPWLLGRDVDAADGLATLYDHSLGDINDNSVAGQAALLVSEDNAQRGLYDPDRAVRVIIASKRDAYGDTNIEHGSLLQGWSGGDNVFWEESGAGIFHETVEGGYIDDGGYDILQKTILVEGGKWVRITLNFQYAMEYTPAGGGSHQAEFQLIADPLDPSGTTEYSTDGGSPDVWTTTPTTLTDTARVPDANGTLPGSLTWYNEIHTLADYMPEDGYIEFKIFGDTGNDFYLHLRDVHVLLEDQAASAVTDTPPWPAHGSSVAVGGSVTEGPTIEYQRPWHPVTWDVDGTPTIDVEVDIDGFGSFQLPAKWEDSSSVSGPYWDLNEWIIRARLARGAGGLLIRGTHLGILTPATIVQALGGRFIVIWCSVDLHTETTEFLVYQELLSISS